MDANFFPWHDPRSKAEIVGSWILNAFSTILSFTPVAELAAAERSTQAIIELAGISGQLFASAGQAALAPTSDPTYVLIFRLYYGTDEPCSSKFLQTLIVLGKTFSDAASNGSIALDSWSKSVFLGQSDASGHNIL
jgi:hypothetical protein